MIEHFCDKSFNAWCCCFDNKVMNWLKFDLIVKMDLELVAEWFGVNRSWLFYLSILTY